MQTTKIIPIEKLLAGGGVTSDVCKVITPDRLFKNNDQLKTNTALQMEDAGIAFKAV